MHLAVEHVGSGALHCVIELVLPQPRSSLAHPVVGPASILRSVQHAVMLDSGKALLQDRSVQEWIEGVAGNAKSVDLARHNSLVLLRRQILCKIVVVSKRILVVIDLP